MFYVGDFPAKTSQQQGKELGLQESVRAFGSNLRIIEEMRPKFVFIENSPMLRTRGLVVVLQGLARLGYDAKWCKLGAWHVGAPHKRDRMWIKAVAHASDSGLQGGPQPQRPDSQGRQESNGRPTERGGLPWLNDPADERIETGQFGTGAEFKPQLDRVAYGVANRVDRSKAIGNGQVPQCAAIAWELLSE